MLTNDLNLAKMLYNSYDMLFIVMARMYFPAIKWNKITTVGSILHAYNFLVGSIIDEYQNSVVYSIVNNEKLDSKYN